MTPPAGDAARKYADLSPRDAQEALREELLGHAGDAGQDADGPEADDPDTEEQDLASLDVDAPGLTIAERASGDVEAAADPVYSAIETAQHLRMAEALLFAAREPLDVAAIASRLPPGVDVPALLATLVQSYENRGVNLTSAGGRWRFLTAPDVAHVLQRERIDQRRLSRAALETLAIIAYHQPCTRADIEDVRGVAVSKGSLDQLLEIGWVRLRGRRRDAPGRPALYGTTPAFLEHFNLESVADLPGMADLRAAGLLDARLPPGFAIPSPVDAGDGPDENEAEGEAAAGGQGWSGEGAPAFVHDFHDVDDHHGDDASGDEC